MYVGFQMSEMTVETIPYDSHHFHAHQTIEETFVPSLKTKRDCSFSVLAARPLNKLPLRIKSVPHDILTA